MKNGYEITFSKLKQGKQIGNKQVTMFIHESDRCKQKIEDWGWIVNYSIKELEILCNRRPIGVSKSKHRKMCRDINK